MKQIGAVFFVFLLFSRPAFPDDANWTFSDRGPFSISQTLGTNIFDDSQDLKNGMAAFTILGYRFSDRFTEELVTGFIEASPDHPGKTNEPDWQVRLDTLWFPKRCDTRFRPYVSFGVGTTGIHEKGNDFNPIAAFGGGFFYDVSQYAAFRCDIRNVVNFVDSYDNLLCSFGISIFWGADEASPVGVFGEFSVQGEVAGAEIPSGVTFPTMDEDIDPAGVIGAPDLPSGIQTGSEEAVDYYGMLSTPELPEGITPVVPDSEIEEQIESLNSVIYFDKNDYKVHSDYRKRIVDISAFLVQNPAYRCRISGHSDNTGGDAYNMELSKKRAMAVAEQLTENNEHLFERLDIRWFGEKMPVADNTTPEGRRRNRRVSVGIVLGEGGGNE